MEIIFSLNQDSHWSYSQIVVITLLILSSCQSGSLLVNSIHNMDNCILQLQNTKGFSNNSNNTAISKKIAEVKQPEQEPFVNHLGEVFEGFNLFQFRDLDNPPPNFKITDMDGRIIDEFQIDKTDGYGVPINSTTFLLVFENSTYFWNIETGRNQLFDFSSHHDISYNPMTKTFMTLETYTIINPYVTIPGQILIDTYAFDYDAIREINMDGDVIWELNSSSFVPYDWWSGELTTTGNMDVTHSNSVFWDIEDDMIYLNIRNLNTFFKIDHKTGEVLWGLGEHGDFTLFDHYGIQRQNLFYHSHALKKVDNSTFILFDNDYLNKTNANNHRSRLLEITINETTMTANISWVWTGVDEYYSAYWGDVDRLPNGNRFGAFGTQTHPGTDIGPRFVEVNEAGEIVWEMYYKGGKYGIYRAERYRQSPILSTPEDKMTAIGDPIRITWQTWYNFRSKITMKGSYKLYRDGNAINDGEVVFDKFWRPTNLTFDLNSLEQGKYIFTLVVADEGGHTAEDTVIVYVGISPSEATSNSVTIPSIVSLLLGLGIMIITRIKKRKLKSEL